MIKQSVLTSRSAVRRQSGDQFASQPRAWALSLASFGFILLQSACLAVMTLSGLRLAIGVGSLAAATLPVKLLVAIHGQALRVPMVLLALAGSLINLYVIWRIRSLRSRPSSAWRVRPASRHQKRAETIQIVLAILTLMLVAAEWWGHTYLHGSLFA